MCLANSNSQTSRSQRPEVPPNSWGTRLWVLLAPEPQDQRTCSMYQQPVPVSYAGYSGALCCAQPPFGSPATRPSVPVQTSYGRSAQQTPETPECETLPPSRQGARGQRRGAEQGRRSTTVPSFLQPSLQNAAPAQTGQEQHIRTSKGNGGLQSAGGKAVPTEPQDSRCGSMSNAEEPDVIVTADNRL